MNSHKKRQLVVVGNGMVGHHFVEKAVAAGLGNEFEITIVCEEQALAYDRVNLSKFFDGDEAARALSLTDLAHYDDLGVTVLVGDAAVKLDCAARQLETQAGKKLNYDKLVLATGSRPFVPPIEGANAAGCFVYRTLEDLEGIRNEALKSKVGVVIGGGLLGLEAAKALQTLGLDTHVVELAPRLMPLQVDEAGGAMLRARIEELGVHVHLGVQTAHVALDEHGHCRALAFNDGSELPVDMVVFSAGIRPRDELARGADLAVAKRGGVSIDRQTKTSDDDILAIGECAAVEGRTYGQIGRAHV